MVWWLKLRAPNAEGLGSVPGWGTRSHTPQLKILNAANKTWCSQIDKFIFKKRKKKKRDKVSTPTLYLTSSTTILGYQSILPAVPMPTPRGTSLPTLKLWSFVSLSTIKMG